MTQMWEEIMEQPAVLKRCITSNAVIIRELSAMVKSQEITSIFIAARGTSDHAAVYGKYVLELLTGIPTGLAAPSVFTLYQKNLSLRNSLVLGISQSGQAADVLEVIRGANAQGGVTAAITNNPESPLAAEAKYHLYCHAGTERSVAATKTFTAQLCLLALLAAEWAGRDDVKQALQSLPGQISGMFDVAQTIAGNVQRYRFMNECFVLARGVNYAVALEAALKIQETSYVRAKAYATSDFYHGPLALVERDIPFLIFAPDGPTLNDLRNMVAKLREKETEMIIVSNKNDLLPQGTFGIPIPETDNDLISPFYNVIVAQIFAHHLSRIKGHDPDHPRSLTKVTITK